MSDQQRSNRRDFLKGKSARDAIGSKITTPTNEFCDIDTNQAEQKTQSADQPISNDGTTETQNATSLQRQASYLEQYSKNPMACEFEFLFNLHQYTQAGMATADAFAMIDKIEDQMTVYCDHSEVSRLNQMATSSDVVVEQRLFELLTLALKLHQETGGAFDITSGSLTKLWQFDRRSGSIPDDESIQSLVGSVGSQHIKLDSSTRSVRFERSGVSINLGGIGKGHAIDRVAKRFLDLGINDFVIHGGQSSVLAHGSSTELDSSGDSETKPGGWKIGLSHPSLPNVRLAEVTLCDQALGTSGTGRQGFFHKGKRYGHIIDPRSGWPSSHILSSTVITDSAAQADALATGFFVMQPTEVAAFCDEHPEVAAILVLPGDKGGAVKIETFNLPEEKFRLL